MAFMIPSRDKKKRSLSKSSFLEFLRKLLKRVLWTLQERGKQ